MQIKLFSSVEALSPFRTIECEGFTARTFDPFNHEVIALRLGGGPKEMLITVTGDVRQATSPLQCHRIEVHHKGEIIHTAAIDGSANQGKAPHGNDELAQDGSVDNANQARSGDVVQAGSAGSVDEGSAGSGGQQEPELAHGDTGQTVSN